MKKFLQKLIKALAYAGAATVILLAIAVGIFRLMLPRLPEYQEEIKDWASAAIGMEVEFSGMNARWRLSGPELIFFDANLSQPDTGTSLLMAEEVSVGVGLIRLIADRELVVDRIGIRDSAIDLRQDENGKWLLQGLPLAELINAREGRADKGGNVEIIAQNIAVEYEHPASGQLVAFTIRSFEIARTKTNLVVEVDLDLPDELGDRLEISANQLSRDSVEEVWRLFVEGDSLSIPGWSKLQPVGMPDVDSGMLDLSAWVDVSGGTIQSATANVDISDLHVTDREIVAPFGVQGRFEFSAELDGWLLAAEELQVSTVDADWPRSTLQLRVINGSDGVLEGMRASASYFNLDDLKYIMAWMPPQYRGNLVNLDPSGQLQDFNLELSQMRSDDVQFDVAADLVTAGFAAFDEQPGLRGFSGRIRADRDGGRVEIESTDLSLDLGAHLSEPLLFDDVLGTVIWRRNRDGMIVLSDSVRIRNADLDSQLSLQVSVPSDGSSPFVDFESTWSVYDVSAINRYLPLQAIPPTLRQWLSDALVSGRVSRATTRFNGALDKFPFEDGDGAFHIEARLEEATLEFSRNWPAPHFQYLDIVVENTRLFSLTNSAVNLGNSVVDARIEIPDLRKPVLIIDAFATSSLKSIHDYATQSPINDVLGGQLNRVMVDGEASFDLLIDYPIQNKEDFDFSTTIRVSDGTVRVQGFAAPITQLNGTVTISRNDVVSESLFGQFLGELVDLKVSRLGDDLAAHSVILDATGRTTASALETELGIPLGDIAEGDMAFVASVRFPNARAAQPGLLQVHVESDLFGLAINLPEPLAKSDDESMSLALSIEFPEAAQISATGNLAGDINWTARFLHDGDRWDFDRGVLAVGGEYPQDADVRGLHIAGQTAELDLHAWLAVGRGGSQKTGLGDRIRSINMDVDRFYAIGQKFTNHRIEVNRSGHEWLIQISGDEALGLITVPYDFTDGRPMRLDMERLILPGDDDAENSTENSTENNMDVLIDPRSLPAISVRAAEFAIGDRHLGQLEIDIERTDRGLESSNLKTSDDTFTITGKAGWIVDAYEESGQRTFIEAQLESTNAKKTSRRLDYGLGIVSKSMIVDLDVDWPGGPRKDFMGLLNGVVKVSVGAGKLADVDPGAGRVFGLMSFAALPRRLALDFRDVFNSGFSFDSITGSFRLVNGEAFTCDLTLQGTAADVGIIGRAGLEARDYDQSVIVSANVGNTLPVVGVLLGGPQVAAALLVFSQIFKKPLKDMGQVYYAVEGSWDEPTVDKADSQRFADTSTLAGCIDDS